LSFDLERSLRRLKPGRRTAALTHRPDAALPFLAEPLTGGPELLLDTCVYIDVLQGRAPSSVKELLTVRLSNHSGIALAELTHLFGRLDPRDRRTAGVLREISRVISNMPTHRLNAPSLKAFGEAGILAGVAARLTSAASVRRQVLLNDAVLYMQAMEQGHVLLTRNVREFDWFDQILPNDRVLFYHQS
jgi:predicted nucleic acid-binding protein